MTRQEQDDSACRSQNIAEAAIKGWRFEDKILLLQSKQKKKIVVDTDRHPIFDTSMKTLTKLKLAFKKNGAVTAGNVFSINDAAYDMVLMSKEKIVIKPMDKILGYNPMMLSLE